MNPCVFIIFSLVLLCFETTTAYQLVAVGGGGDSNGVANKCSDEERHVLLDFRAHLQDPEGILSTWRAEVDDCCIWQGVTCNNQTGHITKLDLFGYNLNGTISRSIGSLTELRKLDLSYNSFYGTIPPEFGNLTNLQGLYLEFIGKCKMENLKWLSHLSHLEDLRIDGISLAKENHWVDVILSLPKLSVLSLERCELSEVMYPYSSFLNSSSSSSIEYLYLGNNTLTSSMYRWLFLLTSNKLRDLDLSNNMLDGIPKYLGNLCGFEHLDFGNNSAARFSDFLNNLSGCASRTLETLYAPQNQFTGSLSDEIQKFSSLEYLVLFDNHLNGTISDKLWELPRLKSLNVGFNDLRVPSTDHMPILSNIKYIHLMNCKLGPHFPKWIQSFKNLTVLGIANTSISDTVPMEFWDMWPSRLQYLDLSSNNISGKILDLSSNFDVGSMIDLSFNNFNGPIPNVSSTMSSLNLSRNRFCGGISFLCQMVDGFLQFLDLSHNSLSGHLPDCLWHFKELKVLNLGNNNLYGRIPATVGSLIKLEALYLYKNNFSGELPSTLKNCTMLKFLNLGANKFSGNVPIWIGENLSGLYLLILTSNEFFGTVPFQLCELAALQILDLSMNHLHGSIPSCFNNITSMVQEGLLSAQNVHHVLVPLLGMFGYSDLAMIKWQGAEREFIRSNLRLLKSIDLSSNNLTGQIPYEITALHELIALNLSNNALIGEIPRQIGEMKKLLVLDISRNNLSGRIPSSMSQMTLLGYLDVSFNNLSGRIPISTQLQSFEPSRYNGNTRLCGPPLTKKCPGYEELEVPSVVGRSEGDEEDIDEDERWFYIGGGTGFVTGFLIACGALLLNRPGRHAFSHLYDGLREWVYVKVAVFIAMQRDSHT